jgi:HSP20 family protein
MLVQVRERPPRADSSGLEREVDRIFRSFWADGSAPARARSAFAVTPDKDGVTIRAEVPGVEPSAINIAVEGRTLTVSGERTAPPREGTYRVRERSAGKFSHTFYLTDDLDPDAIDAQCHNGVLTIRVPKSPEAKPRQIEVKSS